MDQRLYDRLKKLEDQIDVLAKAERLYLNLEANKDVLYATMFREAQGKSVADKEAEVYSSESWIAFSKKLSDAQAEYNRQRRWYELRLKAYDAEHLSFKVGSQSLTRQGA